MRGEMRPGGSERRVVRCGRAAPDPARVARRVAPGDRGRRSALARELLPSWQGVDRHPAAGAGVDRLREALIPSKGWRFRARSGSATCCHGGSARTRRPGWTSSRPPGNWPGSGPGPRPQRGRMALYFRDDAGTIGPPGIRGPAPGASRARPRGTSGAARRVAMLLHRSAGRAARVRAGGAPGGLWDLVWAGEATNDAFAPLRAPRLTLARAQPGTERPRRGWPALRRPSPRRAGDGPGPLVAGRACSRRAEPRQRRRVLAELLLERYGIVTREQVLAESVTGGFSALYDALSDLETLGVCRRGYFVEGLGGAQFALPGAVERLRAQPTPRAPGDEVPRRWCSPRPTPPSRTAPRCAGPSRATRTPEPPRGAHSASPARTSCWPAPSRCSTSSAAAARW